ncbi:MAG: hypothetical protein KatS3mg115_0950 [Candidatus Poribacteria bacterium]|nr:MAG: hypothetical protein KatS3mg115_0950 [Candidatus Poribacteria bacterium]
MTSRRRVRFYVGGNAAAENARRATAKADLWNQTMPRPVRFVPDDGSRKFYPPTRRPDAGRRL